MRIAPQLSSKPFAYSNARALFKGKGKAMGHQSDLANIQMVSFRVDSNA